MSELKVVPIGVPNEATKIVASLERLIARVNDGEFETVVVIGFAVDGSWTLKEVGKKQGRLATIGMLETVKADFIAGTETGLPSGL
jgi:hypothetical protein